MIGGFEDGTLLLWDERNTNMELTSCQLFHEPGIYPALRDSLLCVGKIHDSVLRVLLYF